MLVLEGIKESLMVGDRIVGFASAVGSLTGMVAPYLLVAVTRWFSSTMIGFPFEYGLLFGAPLAGGICGGVAGAQLGRGLPAKPPAAARRRVVWLAMAAGCGAAVAWSLLVGAVAFLAALVMQWPLAWWAGSTS